MDLHVRVNQIAPVSQSVPPANETFADPVSHLRDNHQWEPLTELFEAVEKIGVAPANLLRWRLATL